MVNPNQELELQHVIINEQNLQSYLEDLNPSYRFLRGVYNQLINAQVNPLQYQGVSTDRLSFIIILLEKILRTTNIILDQNDYLKEKITILDQKITYISDKNLEPIIQAGNSITEELKLFKAGFQDWNNQFETFEKTFNNWDAGFKTIENKFNNIETLFNNWNEGFKTFEKNFGKFEYNFTKLDTFSNNFANFWKTKISHIEANLKTIEVNLAHWDQGITSVNTNIQNIEQNLKHLPITSSHKKIYRKLEDSNHNFTF